MAEENAGSEPTGMHGRPTTLVLLVPVALSLCLAPYLV